MRVCVISSIFPPYNRGGAEVVVEATARIFAQAGHQVVVVTCAPFEGWRSFAGAWGVTRIAADREQDSRGSRIRESRDPAAGEWPSRLPSAAIRVFRFTPLNLFTIFSISKHPPLLRLIWHVLDMFNLHTYLVVRRILREEKPDLIITRNLKGLGFTVPLAIKNVKCKIKNTRWMHGLHDLNALHPRGFMEWGKESAVRKPNPAVRLYRGLARLLIGSPDAVVAPSRFVLDEYERAGFFPRSKKVVLPNPVAHNPPQPSLTLREGGQSFPPLSVRGGAGGVMKFLYLGQLEPYKGLRVLVEAWRQFVPAHPQARLEIVGQGSMEEELRRAAKMIPGIALRGFVPHENLDELYVNARATILPSLAYETFGMSVAESLVHGVPVICSRIGALSEIVDDGVNGILVSPGDPVALKAAMERVLREKFNSTAFRFFAPAQYCEALEKMIHE